ncbi:3D domain-containing protein [Clostridium botulinum]|uniref:3D domain-containing protein n=1 Tax=Clostridium botulinum TaxID=1491 RepID=UPI0007748D9A|nr:3D domain-containing protein [Clostridium botulinum]
MFRLVTNRVDILPYSNNLSWESNADTLGTQLTFDTIKDLAEGQVVSLYESDNELIRGVIIHKSDKTNTFSYTVQDYSFYLKNKVLKQFNNLQASECIKALIKDAYLQGNITNIPTLITQIYKDKTLAEIIDDILSKSSNDQGIRYIREIEGNKINIFRLEDMKIIPNVIVGDYIIDSSIENMKNDIQVVSSEEKYNSIIASASDETKYSWYGKLSDTISVDVDNVAQAKNIAVNKLSELNKIEKSTSIPLIILDEKVEIKANRYIYLHSGKLIGYYFVKSARHTLSDGLHKCDIEIKLDVEPNILTSSYENKDAIANIISNNNKNSSGNNSTNSGDVDFSNATEITMSLSFYTGAANEGGSESASGKALEYGMCASNVYPFGTQFKLTGIDGLDDGVFTVEDRGGNDFNSANRLDIYVGNGSDAVALANNLGRQTCTAYKLNS